MPLPEGLAHSKLGSITPEAEGLLSAKHQEKETEKQQEGERIKRGLSL